MKKESFSQLMLRARGEGAGSLFAAGLALLVSSILMILFLSLMMRTDLINEQLIKARIIAANSPAVLLFEDRDAGREMLSSFAMSQPIEDASLFFSNGKLLVQYSGEDSPAFDVLPEAWRQSHYKFGMRQLIVVQSVSVDGKDIGYVVLRFGLGHFYQRLLGYVSMILIVALAAFLIMKFSLSRMEKMVNKAESNLEYLAHTDPITQLPNRHAFNKKLAESLELASQCRGEVGLVLLDLDNFKVVNDTMGHQCGDELLRMFAQRLLETTRSADTVCRIGGDEFVVIVSRIGRTSVDVLGISKRILTVMAEPFKIGVHEFFLTASVGSSLYPWDAGDSETLIRKADAAMYSAKLKGKNTFETFMPEMDQIAQRRLALENSLRRALERNELVLHYQPQIDLRSRKVVGAEALMRWNHPEYGLVSPAEFIPVAEETGLIVALGKWALQAACQQAAAWNEAGFTSMRIAVNLSARQMRDPDLMQYIENIIRLTGLPPAQLELEITEGIMMENVHSNIKLLHGLQKEGICLAIDDFGTGYSSMAYLKRFPIDQLKIDRSFVQDIHAGSDAIIGAILAMAHSLGISVVAEGVETEDQLHFLESMACDSVQGFYFSRPLPSDQFLAYCQEMAAESSRQLAS